MSEIHLLDNYDRCRVANWGGKAGRPSKGPSHGLHTLLLNVEKGRPENEDTRGCWTDLVTASLL